MVKTTRKTANPEKGRGAADPEQARYKRFLYLWVPVISIVLIFVYAAALDPSKPTGATIGASLIGKSTKEGTQPPSSVYRVLLDSGEETEVFIPENLVPPPGGRIFLEEHVTTLFKKRSYQYLRASDGTGIPSTQNGGKDPK